MSFLIFDVDRSLASIGGLSAAETISGTKPIQISQGLLDIRRVLPKLFIKREYPSIHPLLEEPLIEVGYEANELCKKMKLQGFVIDTISHLFRLDMRLLEAKNKSERLELQDWGKLERTYNQFLSSLIQLPVWVIVNSHITYDKNDLGQFLFTPQLKGSTKDFIAEYFDCILFTKITKVNNKTQYNWQTKPDGQKYAKDRLGILEEIIPQDFNLILSKYQERGILYPKILVIGESGTGKTKAIETLATKPNENPSRKNGKASIEFYQTAQLS